MQGKIIIFVQNNPPDSHFYHKFAIFFMFLTKYILILVFTRNEEKIEGELR